MHSHQHEAAGKVLLFSLSATMLYIILLVIFGLRAHSLALISEAGHNFSDFLALSLSWVALYFQSRPATATKTYGYQRAGVLAAFINALTLILVAAYICYEAALRLAHPAQVESRTMMIVAAAGVLLNGAISWMLFRSAHASDVNLRSVLIHQLGDTLSTAAVILGGFLIWLTGAAWIDPLLSLAIAALILWSSWDIIRETLNILLEGTPKGVELDRVIASVTAVEGVRSVHDLHIWCLGSNSRALSCHIGIDDIPPSESEAILRNVRHRLEHFRIVHTTIQFEHADCEVAHGCVMPISSSSSSSSSSSGRAHDHTHSH
ncbi:MAG: cation diffusion facilitator family transporter [Acidobacteriaceae bacterium]